MGSPSPRRSRGRQVPGRASKAHALTGSSPAASTDPSLGYIPAIADGFKSRVSNWAHGQASGVSDTAFFRPTRYVA